MLNNRLSLCVFTLLCLAAGVAPGQTNSMPARKLSLAEALDLANSANLDVQLAVEKIREAAGQVTTTRSELLPELKAGISEARQDHSTAAFGLPDHGEVVVHPSFESIKYPGTSDAIIKKYNLPTKLTVNTDQPVPIDFNFSDTTGPYNFFNGKLYLDVPLIDLKNFRVYEASKSGEKKAHLDTNQSQEEAMALAAQYYQAVLFTKEGVRVLKKKVGLHEQRVSLSEDLLKSGVATVLQVSKEKSDLAAARTELVQGEIQLADAIRQLKRQLNLDPMEEFELTDPLDFRPLAPPDEGDATRLSYERRPDYLAQKQKEKSAMLERDAAKADYYPTVKATANYGEQGLSPDDTVEAWFIGASAEIPIWDSYKRSGNLTQKESQYQQERNRTRDLENQMWNDIRDAKDALAYNESSVLSGDEEVRYYDDALTEKKDEKAAGTATDLDVTSAEVDLANSHFRRVQALYEYNLAQVKWFKAIGEVRDVTLERAAHPLWNPGPDADTEEAKDGVEQGQP